MILFGASGHAKVIIDILTSSGQQVEYLVDANPEISDLMGYRVIHESRFDLADCEAMIISIGSNKIRKRIAGDLSGSYGKAIHPATTLAENTRVGQGTVIMAGVIINPDVTIGSHAIINTSASIDHDCVIGDYAHVSPNATLCGNISIGEGAHIGAGATIIPNLKIGKWATIGAGSVIISDVPDYAVVVGNPGRIIRYNDR